ncbi:hypothetical protein, partial [Endozoicomonas sp. SESOKO2]|uniref:hypothetical protein n=2 Tax=unclassified Endozoicomonas TaxID=2644528 RepID=UPI002148DE4C
MTNARSNALSLAVAVAISSSIISTQALAERKLQIKSVDISGNGHVEFIQSEVILKPTLGDDQEPIPKSFTTTYPDLTQARADYLVPSNGFTEVLSFIDGAVSSVDLFETDENGAAQKYTKVLKVGGEGIFRFTHNLEEEELVIEVRGGMTDQDSVEAVRDQITFSDLFLEPLTKIASPAQLYRLLQGADDRAGNLGTSDHYVALATIEVEKVEVSGRTFMRLISGRDQPPELKRLGQSLFVNDEVLLAAATSAYMQVHVLKGNLQQEALNKLLSYHKPVGYVVHIEDNRQTYPVPTGYPKLEVTEAPGEIIVFHGQKQNSADIAFVETLYTLWQEAEGNNHALAVTTKVKNLKIESYQYAIRSRQMAVLEEWDARYEAGEAVIGENEARKRAQEDQTVMFSLDFYESLQQALTSATPTDHVHEFEFSLEHIRVASLFITPIWLQVQLAKHFSFKPVIKGLLTNPHFIRSILSIIPVSSELQTEFLYKNEEFANQVLSDMARQLIEIESTQEELQIKEAKLIQLKSQLRLTVDKAIASEKKKLRAQQIRLQVEDELAQLRNIHEVLHSQTQTLQQEAQRIPALEQKIRDARKESRKVYNSELAIQLGIDDWDDTQPLDEQARRLSEKINDMNRAVAATFTGAGLLDEEAVKAKLAAIEGRFDIKPLNEDDPGARSRSIQQHLHYRAELLGEEAPHRLAIIESQLGLVSDDEAHPKTRRQAIQQHLKQLEVQLVQQRIQQQSSPTEAEKADTTKDRLALIASHLNIKEFDGNADIDVQQNLLLWRIESLNAQVQKAQCCRDDTIVKVMTSALAAIVGIKLNEDTTEEDINALMEVIHDRFQRLEDTEELLSDIRTPGHPISKPKVLDKLRAVEKALKMDNLDSEDDEYYRRHAISKDIQAYITKAGERAEEEALDILEAVEETLGINIKEGDDKAARLDRVRTILDGNDVTEKKLDDIQYTLWEEEIDFDEDRDTKLDNLRARLASEVEDTNERAREQQEYFLGAIEYRLGIDTSKNVAAKKRGRDFVAKVADDLKVKFKQDVGLDEQKYVLQSRIRALKYELDQTYNDLYDDESIIETKYNEIAHLLGVENYIDDGTLDVQFNLITEKLQQLYEKVFKAGQPEVHERIAAIENELDRQMAHLGPKPRYVLDRELARARGNIEEAESELDELHRKLGAIHRQQVVFADSTNIDPETGKDKTTPNQLMKKLQTELGLTPVDKQTTGERVNDIRHLLQSAGSEKHDEIVQKLRAATSELKISVEGNAERLAEEDYFDAIITYTDTHGQDEVEHAMGELPETRKKYAQVTKFLHEHALKEMELTSALDEEKQAREELNTKNQAMHPSKEIDSKTKTKLEHNRQVLDLVLKQKKTKILKAQKAMMAHKKDLKAIEDDMGIKPDPTARYADRVDALRKKQIEMGGLDGTGGKILQLTREQDSLNREIEVRKGEIEQLKGVLKAAEEAVENEGGSFQYTPRQANILTDIYAYGQSHSLKKQALEAAIGLAESAELSGKLIPNLHTFDLDDEFAPIRLQALAGNHLRFDQARRIVEVFKNLKTAFTIEPAEGQCLNPLGEVQNLADWARTHIKTGPQQYDDEIRGMGA